MDCLVIHSLRRGHLNLDLSRFTVTMDDSLYSQYYYYPLLRNNGTKLIYFITTGLVQPGGARKMFAGEHMAHVKSSDYMYDAFTGRRFDHLMTVEEVRILSGLECVELGIHSHFHDVIVTRSTPRKPLSQWKIERSGIAGLKEAGPIDVRSKLAFRGYYCLNGHLVERSQKEWMDYIRYDTESSLQWFSTHLGFTPNIYAFPFNEYTPELVSILEGYGFREFFAGAAAPGGKIHPRIDADKILFQQRDPT